MFFTGHQAFLERHDQILKTVYRGSTKHEDIVLLKFVRPDVAIVETLETITGYQKLLPGTSADAMGVCGPGYYRFWSCAQTRSKS